MRLDCTDNSLPPVGALLRRPEVIVRREVMASLHEAGFDDVLPAHLGVFQHPGPDGQRPGVLALRSSASKQAMNHLLHQLESGGYLTRESHPDDRRTRVVRLTERGWAAFDVIRQTLGRLEQEWCVALGPDVYDGLAHALERLQALLDPLAGPPALSAGSDSRPDGGEARAGAVVSGSAQTPPSPAALSLAPPGRTDVATPRDGGVFLCLHVPDEEDDSR